MTHSYSERPDVYSILVSHRHHELTWPEARELLRVAGVDPIVAYLNSSREERENRFHAGLQWIKKQTHKR